MAILKLGAVTIDNVMSLTRSIKNAVQTSPNMTGSVSGVQASSSSSITVTFSVLLAEPQKNKKRNTKTTKVTETSVASRVAQIREMAVSNKQININFPGKLTGNFVITTVTQNENNAEEKVLSITAIQSLATANTQSATLSKNGKNKGIVKGSPIYLYSSGKTNFNIQLESGKILYCESQPFQPTTVQNGKTIKEDQTYLLTFYKDKSYAETVGAVQQRLSDGANVSQSTPYANQVSITAQQYKVDADQADKYGDMDGVGADVLKNYNYRLIIKE